MAVDQKGEGVILNKGLSINAYHVSSNKSLAFTDFFATNENDAKAYVDITNPASGYNNTLSEELQESISAITGDNSYVYTGSVLSNGKYQETSSSVVVPISCNIPANGIGFDTLLKNIYVCVTDKEIMVRLTVSNSTNFSEGETITKTGTPTTNGIISKIWVDSSSNHYLYLKTTGGVFVVGDAIDNGGIGSTSITAIDSNVEITVPSVAGFAVGEIIEGQTSEAYGYVYKAESGVLYLYGVEGTFTSTENIIGLTSGTTQSISSLSYTNFDFVYFQGFFAQDSVLSSIVEIQYIDAGTDLSFPINITRTSGLPTSYLFNDTRAVEIYIHDNDPTAHNLVSGSNITYTYNTDFTSVAELQNLIYGLPKIIQHTVTFDGFDGASNLSVGTALDIYRNAPYQGFDGGSIIFQNFDDIDMIITGKGTTKIAITSCTFTRNTQDYCIYGAGGDLYVGGCTFNGSGYESIIFTLQESKLSFESCVLDNFVPTTRPDHLVIAKARSIVHLNNFYANNDEVDFVDEEVLLCYEGATIFKYDLNLPISVSTTHEFERTYSGGQIFSPFGMSNYKTNAGFVELSVTIYDSDSLAKIQHRIDMAGKYIPEKNTLSINFPAYSPRKDFNADKSINFSGFYGGGDLIIEGDVGYSEITNSGASGKPLFGINNNNVRIEVLKMDFMVNANSVSNSAIDIVSSDCFIYNCNLFGADSGANTITSLIEVSENSVVNVYDNTVGTSATTNGVTNFVHALYGTTVTLENNALSVGSFTFEPQYISYSSSAVVLVLDATQPKSGLYDVSYFNTDRGGKVIYADAIYINGKTITAI